MAFVQTSGVNFTLDGQRWVPIGGATYGYYGSNAAFANRVAAARVVGFNILRYINYARTGEYPDYYDPTAGAEFNETIWARMDYGVDQARLAGIKILIDLSEIQGFSDARGYTFGDVNHLLLYKNFVEWLAVRVNTVNGRLWKNDDAIAIFAISGEVGQQGAVGSTTNYDTYHAIGGYMKAAGFQQLIHPGGQKPEQNVDASYGHTNYSAGNYLDSPNLDCISTHPYYTQQNMIDLFPEMQSYSIAKNKPWFIEEFGYTSNNDITRAALYKFVFNEGFKRGSAGGLVWNFDEGGADGYGYAGYTISLTRTPDVLKVMKAFARAKQRCIRYPID